MNTIEDNNNEFDLKLRSILENAEEEFSPALWDGIAEGLASQKKRRGRVIAWRWSAAAASIAAAVAALGVFLFPAGNSADIDIDVDKSGQYVSDNQDVIIPEDDALTEEFIPSGIPSVRPRVVVAANNVAPVEPVAETVAETVADEGRELDEDIAAEVMTADENAGSQENKKPVEASEPISVQEGDPFAAMEAEDMAKSAKTPRVSVHAGGSAQTNANASALARRSGMSMAPGIPKPIEQKSAESSYSIPISAGAGVRFAVIPRLYVGTGVNYSLLQRSFTGTYTKLDSEGRVESQVVSDIHNTLHYIGIPLTVSYDFVKTRHIDLYAHAGGEVEKGLVSKFRVGGGTSKPVLSESISGVQASVEAGLGVSFALVDKLKLYIDPSVRYYFDCGQPVSIRTQQPLMFSMEVGLRFDI